MSNVFTIRSIITGEESKVLDLHREALDAAKAQDEDPFRVAPKDSYENADNDSAPLQFSSLIGGRRTDSVG